MSDDKSKTIKSEEDLNAPLMSDDDWVDLVSAQHKAAGASEDELSKKRVWRSLSNRIWGQRLSPSLRAFAAAALVVVLGIPAWLLLSPVDHYEGLKGGGDVFAQMRVYAVLDDGSLAEKQKFSLGETLVFKIKIFEPVFASLYYVYADGQVRMAVEGQRVESFEETLFLKDGKAYGFQIDKKDSIVAFCPIFGKTLKDVKNSFGEIKEQNLGLADSSCVEIGLLEK